MKLLSLLPAVGVLSLRLPAGKDAWLYLYNELYNTKSVTSKKNLP
jgi:hypothetical protein